jgi:hypothetical protein
MQTAGIRPFQKIYGHSNRHLQNGCGANLFSCDYAVLCVGTSVAGKCSMLALLLRYAVPVAHATDSHKQISLTSVYIRRWPCSNGSRRAQLLEAFNHVAVRQKMEVETVSAAKVIHSMSNNKMENIWCVEYTDIPKAILTPRHVVHCCTHVIPGYYFAMCFKRGIKGFHSCVTMVPSCGLPTHVQKMRQRDINGSIRCSR